MSTSTVLMTSEIGTRWTSTSNIERSIASGFIPWLIVRFPCGSRSITRTRLPLLVQRDAEVERRRRLRDAALLVREGDDVRHQRAFGTGAGSGADAGTAELERRLVDHGRLVLDRLVRDGLGARLEPRQEA